MIGTHNSGTGEPSGSIVSKLLIPFAKCQTKTLKEQYDCGCRYFDLRVIRHENKLVLAHGLWHSTTSIWNAISWLNSLGRKDNDFVNVIITYEGELDEQGRAEFCENIKRFVRLYKFIRLGYVAVKKPEWETLYARKDCQISVQGFKSLEKFPYKLIPIPWIWNIFKHDDTESKNFVLVDFL